MNNHCEYCEKQMIDCLKTFEASLYIDDSCHTHIADKSFNDIDNAIRWAKQKGADYIDVYQGCNRENRILQLAKGVF